MSCSFASPFLALAASRKCQDKSIVNIAKIRLHLAHLLCTNFWYFSRWHSILLVAKSEGDAKHTGGVFGSSTPAVFLHPKLNEIRVEHALSGTHWSGNHRITTMADGIGFKISQEMENGKLMFRVKLTLL